MFLSFKPPTAIASPTPNNKPSILRDQGSRWPKGAGRSVRSRFLKKPSADSCWGLVSQPFGSREPID